MARNDEAAKLVKQGHSLVGIAKLWGISVNSVVQYLYIGMGRGYISRSEVFFSISQKTREAVDSILESHSVLNRWELLRLLTDDPQGLDKVEHEEEALLYYDLREAPMADMFEVLSRWERNLHMYIKVRLMKTHGVAAFWRHVPESVRKDCVRAKEEDDAPQDDPYAYTTFVHLREIFDKKWSELCEGLPKAFHDKRTFLSTLKHLNAIRNRVMHTVRGYRPSKEDFSFVSDFAKKMSAKS